MNSELKFKENFTRLLEEAKNKNEFEFVNVLLGYNGMGSLMSLTHFYESESLFKDLSSILTGDYTNKNNIRIGLFLYCHFFEMDELYRILGNLLRIANNLRFKPFLFEDLSKDDLTPTEKINELKAMSITAGYTNLTDCFDELYSNKLRNSFFHSNYSIDENEYINISNRHRIKLNGKTYHSLNVETELYPLVTACVNIANYFFDEISKSKMSYTSNKIVIGTLSTPEPIIILGDAKIGLLGWESSSGSSIKITDFNGTPFLAAMNIHISNGKAKSENEKKLDQLIEKDKYIKNDSELLKLEQEILTENNSKTIKLLAIPYYNWANNTRVSANSAKNPFEKKALLASAILRYQKSIEYDPDFIQSLHNIALTELEISELNSDTLSNLTMLEKFEGLFPFATEFPGTFFNAGHFAQLAGEDVTDNSQAKALFLKAADYYQQNLNMESDSCKTMYRIATSFWRAAEKGGLDVDKLISSAQTNFQMAIDCDTSNFKYLLQFAIFLEFKATLQKKNALESVSLALTLLEKADGISPENPVLHFRMGIENLLQAQYTDQKEEKEAFLQSALSNYEKSLSILSGQTKVLNNLGLTYIRQAQLTYNERSISLFKTGIDLMDQIINMDPKKYESYYNKVQAYIGLYETTNEKEYLDKAKKLLAYVEENYPGRNQELIDAVKSF